MSTRRFGRGSLRSVTIKGQPAWELDYRDASGKRCRRTAGRTKVEAQAVLAKLIRDRDLELAGMGVERGLSMSIADLAAQYLADLAARGKGEYAHEARRGLAAIEEGIGVRTVRDVNMAVVLAWRAHRTAAGASNATANNDIGFLKSALQLAVRLGQIGANPLAGLRGLPRGRKHQVRPARALSDWELRQLIRGGEELDRIADERTARARANCVARGKPVLDHLRPPVPRAPFLKALALTGARFGELSRVTWSDFDSETATIYLRGETTKNGHPRAIPVASELAEILAELPRIYRARELKVGPSTPIFLSSTGKPNWNSQQQFHWWIQQAYERAGIALKDEAGRVVNIHTLRHTFATRLARSGVPMAVAQKLTGHRSLAILLQVYTHVRDAESRKAIEALPALGVVGNVEPTSDGAERARSSASPP